MRSGTMRQRCVGLALLACLTGAGPTGPARKVPGIPSEARLGETHPSGTKVYFFFSPAAPGAAVMARKAVKLAETVSEDSARVSLRSVLLLDDFGMLSQPTRYPSFIETLEVLQEAHKGVLNLPLYDTEGLRLAKAWGVHTLPAIVLVKNGRAHVAEGNGANPSNLLRCER